MFPVIFIQVFSVKKKNSALGMILRWAAWDTSYRKEVLRVIQYHSGPRSY